MHLGLMRIQRERTITCPHRSLHPDGVSSLQILSPIRFAQACVGERETRIKLKRLAEHLNRVIHVGLNVKSLDEGSPFGIKVERLSIACRRTLNPPSEFPGEANPERPRPAFPPNIS